MLLLACTLFATASVWAQKVDMKYDLQVGNEYTMTQNINMLISQDVMGMSTDMTNDMKYVMSYKVKSFDGSVYDIEVAYKSLATESYSPYGSSKVDSESEGDDVMSRMFRNLKDSSFGLKMDIKGEVTEVYGLDAMIEKLSSDPSFSAQEKALVREQFKASFGEESFRQSMSMSTALPKNPVAVGDKWDTTTRVMNNGIEMIINTKYEYAGISDGMWVIKGTSTIATPAGAKMSTQGMDMDLNFKGTMTSEMKYNTKTGWISTGNTTQDVNGTMSMDVPMQGPMDIGMKLVTKATVSGN